MKFELNQGDIRILTAEWAPFCPDAKGFNAQIHDAGFAKFISARDALQLSRCPYLGEVG